MTFDYVRTAFMFLAFGSVAIGDLFKGKDYIACYRLFNGMAAVFTIAWVNSIIAHQWATQSIVAESFSLAVSVLIAMIFGHKAIESFKLAAEARNNMHVETGE